MFRKIALNLIGKEMQTMGVHPDGIAIMGRKARIEPLKLLQVRAPAANIIKQEMLALRGECATPAVAITCQAKYVDILLLGTTRQYSLLLSKLVTMAGWFDLQKVIADVRAYLQAKEQPLLTRLADGRELTYKRVQVMGILNATPDSFYGASRVDADALLLKAEQMLSEGAAVLDIGGESTRPGATPVTQEEEQQRVVPAIRKLREAFPQSILSIDTYHSATAREALEAGANIINDISAGEADDKMLEVAKEYQAPIILMHKRGTPQTMKQLVKYDHVVEEVASGDASIRINMLQTERSRLLVVQREAPAQQYVASAADKQSLSIVVPGVPISDRALILDDAYYTNLLADEVVSKSFVLPLSQPGVVEAQLRRIGGFDVYPSTVIPENGEKLAGFAAHPSGIALAMRYLVPVANYDEAGAVTDPETGLTFGYLRYTETNSNRIFVTVECLYGFKAAIGDGIKRIVKPGTP